jgi:hypothetical protein
MRQLCQTPATLHASSMLVISCSSTHRRLT